MKKIIVVGAGHAGLEAAFICAKMGCKTYLIVLDEKYVGNCPCNPSIGGPAKGIVTREIDALGGMQAKAADACQLQMKLLNNSKGPGVQALRAQIDKVAYQKWFINEIKKNKNIELISAEVTEILVKNKIAYGVILNCNKKLLADAVILTTGTYMESVTHQGNKKAKEGPSGFKYSHGLSKNLIDLGFKTIRLKTGTPPRIHKDSIDYSKAQLEPGTDAKLAFSDSTNKFVSIEKQLPCYLIYTNDKTHKIIKKNIKDSAMYGGLISGIGPRYCPSIEDKIMRFIDKERHSLFIEPESKKLDSMYLGGFSTSFSAEIQDQLIRTLPGLENCKVISYGYAIEYDALDPIQLYPTLETKLINNLYSAGQINGTSGYEEAAGQGLMAGINAVLKLKNKEPFILRRYEAYIGVMIDDIVTKGITDPYRLLTSRAEHRLLLRNDNAQERLIDHAKKLGLISNIIYKKYLKSQKNVSQVIDFLKTKRIGSYLTLRKLTNNTNFTLYQFLKRPEIKLNELLNLIKFNEIELSDSEILKIEIKVKYEGYINNYLRSLKKIDNFSKIKLPKNFDYKKVLNLSNEAIEKLNKIQPFTLQQASQISGINLPDLVAVKNFLESNNKKSKKYL